MAGAASLFMESPMFRRFLMCQLGATNIEYGLIAGMMGIGAIKALTPVGEHIRETFEVISSTLQSANTNSSR